MLKFSFYSVQLNVADQLIDRKCVNAQNIDDNGQTLLIACAKIGKCDIIGNHKLSDLLYLFSSIR